MMPPLWFFAIILLLVGSLLIRRSIRQLLKWTDSPVIIKLPVMQQSGPFAVTQAGKYAIWQTRKTYGQASVKMPTPIIVSVPDGKRLIIHKSFSNVRVSGFGEGRFQLFTFQAQPGDYQLELPDLNPERAYGLEIRKYRPTYQLVFAILSTILAAAALIGGIVLLMRSIIG